MVFFTSGGHGKCLIIQSLLHVRVTMSAAVININDFGLFCRESEREKAAAAGPSMAMAGTSKDNTIHVGLVEKKYAEENDVSVRT